ncbi:Rha family transcriptional regulator [Fusobacterium necrophorum]|uniref:Rha family transcriptional regulator n=1 Tax=Fusobacterium necrophorum TaxID=859 RepID=UPI0009BFBD04|nr:Rha family transcriptional regulator [Fusobacterium necrophorum]
MNNLVKVERNQKYGFVVSSRNVSVVVKRRHDNVMRDIEKIIAEGSPQIRGLFIKSEYMASNGKKNKEYLLLKDGVILYLFNVQGLYEEKMAYINEFNRMEQAIKEENKLQQTLPMKIDVIDFREEEFVKGMREVKGILNSLKSQLLLDRLKLDNRLKQLEATGLTDKMKAYEAKGEFYVSQDL